MSKVVIFDLDGVLNNLVEATLVRLRTPVNTIDLMTRYKLKECTALPRSLIKRMQREWYLPEAFSDATPMVQCWELKDLAEIPDTQVIIHSLCLSDEVKKAKDIWLYDSFMLDGIEVDLEVGTTKSPREAFISIEDSIENLAHSTAVHRLLVDMPYNQFKNYPELDPSGITRVQSAESAVSMAKELLTNG